MNQRTLLVGKLVLVGLVVAGGFVLVALGRLPVEDLFRELAPLVGQLVVALGLVSAGGVVASRLLALRAPYMQSRPHRDDP